ncbi:VCBS domain-containing protein [Aliivibrio sp. EL58]|uniref:VCBS domain-containing protein n=1 Tax=Aliivibrio sp. EL58 TaxID=2107582 RepID=UPI000EFDA4B0|nr:VCBS domain-containing protein [Aliivibrio sp. EL58]
MNKQSEKNNSNNKAESLLNSKKEKSPLKHKKNKNQTYLAKRLSLYPQLMLILPSFSLSQTLTSEDNIEEKDSNIESGTLDVSNSHHNESLISPLAPIVENKMSNIQPNQDDANEHTPMATPSARSSSHLASHAITPIGILPTPVQNHTINQAPAMLVTPPTTLSTPPLQHSQQQAIISGKDSATTTEDVTTHVTGKLTVIDPDLGEAHFSNTDISGSLGTLHLTNSGAWTYDLDNTNPTVQALGKGSTATDSITVHSADGTPHQVTITVNGTNDKAVIAGTDSGAVTEESQLHASGTLTVTDIDIGETHFSNTNIIGTLGTLHLTDNGSWTYDLDNTNPTVQALGKGRTATDTITVHSADGTPHQVTITVNGTNDKAVIAGTNSGAVTEESQLHTSGTLTVTDVDTGEAHFSNTNIIGTLGTLHLTDNGTWTYDLDNTNPTVQALGQGQQVKDIISVQSADGTPHQITIVVNGKNDAAVITGTTTGAVTEDRINGMQWLLTGGKMHVSDSDSGEAKFDPVIHAHNYAGIGYTSALGAEVIVTPDGDWHYQLDNNIIQVQSLGQGQSYIDKVTVHTVDGTMQELQVTITGTNDAPTVTGSRVLPTGTEDQTLHITQTQLIAGASDIDKNDAGTLHVDAVTADHGTVTNNPDGSFTFHPDKDYNGQVHFTYDVKDAHGGSAQATASTTLAATSDSAIISEVSTDHVTEDGSHSRHNAGVTTELANGQLQVVDPDSGENKFQYSQFGETAVHDPFGGMLRIDSMGNWGYSVNNANLQHLAQGQTETVVYRVHSYDGTAYELHIDVVGTNDAPTVTQVALSNGTEDTHYQMQASQFGFTDVDSGDTLHSVAITDLPPATQGKFVLDGHDITAGQHIPTADISKLQFVPAQDFNGDVQFKYTVNDGHTDSTEATNTLHFDAVGDAAVITGTTTSDVDEGHGTYHDRSPNYAQPGMAKLTNDPLYTDGKLEIIDPDTGEAQFDTKGVGYSYHGTYGQLILNADGNWHYKVTVGSNQQNVATQIDQLGDGQQLTDTITVYSKDGTAQDIVITIHGDNDRPYISSEVTLVTGTEDTALTFTKADLLANTVDVDANDAGKLSIANLLVDHGSVVDNKDGTYTFTPTKDYNGQVHFSYDVTDAHGGITATGANLHLQATGDAATITGIDQGNVTEDRGYIDTQYNLHFDGKLDIVDPDQGEAQFDIQRGHTYHGIGYDTKMGGWVLLQQDGTYTYTIDNRKPEIQNLGSTETLVDKVTIHSVDGTSHEIQITIHGTNDDPKVSSVTTLPAGTEDTDVVLHASDLLANATDIDHNDAGQLSVANLTADHGKITDNHDGTFTFHPALDYNGKVSFSYDVKDAHAGSTATSASMTLAPTSDAAVITGSGSGVKEDINVDISSGHLLGASGVFHVVDPDGPAQSQFPDVLYGGIYQGSHGGDLQVNSNGNYYYHISNYLVQHLSEGETLKEEYTIHSVDGTQHKVEFTVEGTNDKPVLSAQSQSVTEGGTLLSGQMHATDVDTKDTHTFTIDKAVDGLTFNNDGSYTFDPSHASYQNLGVNNDQVIHVQVKVDDHNGGTDTKTLTLVVHGTNDGATIGGQDTFTVQEDHNLTLNSGNTIIYNGQLTITDADAGEDHFDGNLHQNQQTGTWDTGYTTQEGGKLILQSNGSYRYEIDNSLAKIQSLGSSETLIDTVTVRSADGTPHQIQVTIQGDNDAPVVSSAVTLTAGTEDTDVVLHASDLLANATDIDHNDTGKLSVANLIADHGTITDNHDGTFTFHPTQDYNGKASFTYDVQDAHGGIVATSASITLAPTRDAAVISGDDTGTIIEDHNVGHSSLHPVAASGLLGVTDPDAGQDHFQVNQLGEQAIHDPFGGFLRITPSGAWGYEVANSRLQSLAEGEVEKVVYRVYSADHTAHDITITVTGTNDQPTITATTLAHGTEDTHYQMQASQFGFSDIDTGDTLHSIAITDLPSATQGKFVLDGHDVTAGQHIPTADISKLQFVPAQDFNGDVQFKYTVNDGHVYSQEATNTLHIDPVADAATFTGDSGSIGEDTNIHHNVHTTGSATIPDALVCNGHLVISDVDGQGEAALDLKGQQFVSQDGTYGHFVIKANGSWLYTANNNNTPIQDLDNGQTLTDSIEVTSKDGTKHSITVTINGTTDDPVLHSLSDSGVQHSGPVEGNLITGSGTGQGLSGAATDTDSNAHLVLQDIQIKDPVSGYVAVRPGQPHTMAGIGTLAIEANGHYTFTPEAGFTGKVPSMVYRVGDDGGNPIGDSSQNSLSIEVTPPLQHAPTVTAQTVSTNEDITRTFTTSEFGYSDQDGDTLQFVTISSIPSHGLLLLNGNAVTANQQINKADLDAGHLTFTPISNENGANYAQFTFTANDGHQDSASATMIVDVNAVNDAPIVGSSFISSLEDKPHAFTTADFKYSDIDGDALNHLTITNVAHGVLSLNGTTVNVGDDVSASDVSSLIFTPTHNYYSSGVSGLGAVQFTANDGHLDSKEGSILINIASVADPATFSGDSTGVAQEDTTLQASGTLTVSDPDGTTGFIPVQGGSGIAGSKGYGHAHIDANGHWTYNLYNNHSIVQQLGQGQTDTETITVQSADGTHHDIVVTITGTNDLPTVSEKPQAGHVVGQHSVDEDSGLNPAGQLIINDVDGDTTTVALDPAHSAAYGHVIFDSHSGAWVYHLDNNNPAVNALNDNDTLQDKFTLLVDDGHGQKVPQEITMTINGHTDAIPHATLLNPPRISGGAGHQDLHATLGIPPIIHQGTPSLLTGWGISDGHGHSLSHLQGQFGTLNVNPATGELHYDYAPSSGVIKTHSGGNYGGTDETDTFVLTLGGSQNSHVEVHLHLHSQSVHGHSGHHIDQTTLTGMDVSPISTAHPAPPPPPPVQHDEPDMTSQADFTVTLSDDSYLDLTQHAHHESDQKTSHHGAAAYLDALGIQEDTTSPVEHDQPTDMDIVLAQVDQPNSFSHDSTHLDMSDSLEHHDANINHNQDDEHHHHNDIDGLPDIDPNS